MSTHVSAEERETLSLSMAQGRSLRARVLGRGPSTVSRELIRPSPLATATAETCGPGLRVARPIRLPGVSDVRIHDAMGTQLSAEPI
jgi:hypothetical protein